MKKLYFFFLLIGFGCVEHPEPIKIDQAPTKIPVLVPEVKPDTGFLTIWYSVMFREGYRPNLYTCPGGKPSSGFGNTINPKQTNLKAASLTLYDTLVYYYNVVSQKYPYLTNNQKWAVVSIAANCKWNSIFGKNSSFNKSLLKMETPVFEKWCHDAKGNKRMNLLQSRLYEKALFMSQDTFIWVNPYRGYADEETTIANLQQWYKDHYQDRIK